MVPTVVLTTIESRFDHEQHVASLPVESQTPALWVGSGGQFQRASFVGDKAGPGEGVVLAFGYEVPTQHGHLAGGGHRRDLPATACLTRRWNARIGPGALEAAKAASTSIPRA